MRHITVADTASGSKKLLCPPQQPFTPLYLLDQPKPPGQIQLHLKTPSLLPPPGTATHTDHHITVGSSFSRASNLMMNSKIDTRRCQRVDGVGSLKAAHLEEHTCNPGANYCGSKRQCLSPARPCNISRFTVIAMNLIKSVSRRHSQQHRRQHLLQQPGHFPLPQYLKYIAHYR